MRFYEDESPILYRFKDCRRYSGVHRGGPKDFVEMRAKEIEKAELDSFQLMDIAYAWRKMWTDSRALAEVQSHCSLLRHHLWRGYSPERRESLWLRNSLNLSRTL